MYFASVSSVRANKQADDEADDFFAPRQSAGGGASGSAVGAAPAATPAGPAAMAAVAATDLQPSSSSLARDLAAQAAASLCQQKDSEDEEDVPDSWFFPYLILAAAYSPWGGNTPSEWKHLESSSGPKKRKKSSARTEITLDDSNPVCNPAAMARINPNGDAFSRRTHAAAIKKEKENEKKAAREKENEEARKEALSAMNAANDHAKTIGENIAKIAQLKEKEAATADRENKIKALEKKLMLGLGDKSEIMQELEKLLNSAL